MKQNIRCILFVFVSLFVVACVRESNGNQGNYDSDDNAIDANAVDSIDYYQNRIEELTNTVSNLQKDTAELHRQMRKRPNDSVLSDELRKKEEELKAVYEKQIIEFKEFIERSKDTSINKTVLLGKCDDLLNTNDIHYTSFNAEIQGINAAPDGYISKSEVNLLIAEAVTRAVDSTKKSERMFYQKQLNDLLHKIDSIQVLYRNLFEKDENLQRQLCDLMVDKERLEIQHLAHSFDIHTDKKSLKNSSKFTIEFYFNNYYFEFSKRITIFFVVRKMLDGVSNESTICKDKEKTFIDWNNEVKGYTYSQDFMVGKGTTEYKITDFVNYCKKQEFDIAMYTVEAYADIKGDGKCELIGTNNVNMAPKFN